MPTMTEFASTIMNQKYAHTKANGIKENWEEICNRVVKNVMSVLPVSKDIKEQTKEYMKQLKFVPGGRYLYASGRKFHQVNNCFLFKAEDSREGWSNLAYKASMSLMTGGGIGIDYSDVREEGALIKKTGGYATGPISLMQIINEQGRHIMQGGSRRSAIWAGLKWNHPDVHKFIVSKNWIKEVRELKEKDFSFPATLDMTNISIILDDEFFKAYHNNKHVNHALANSVYWNALRRMMKTGEPGFSIDVGENKGETLRNACTEITSKDDSDVCNLGQINLSRIESIEEMKSVVECGIVFLLCGTIYSDVPFDKIKTVREKNRRLGLGIMGIHDWLLKNGKKYNIDSDLEKYLNVYKTSGSIANKYADLYNISRPIKTRAIAPTGTVSIVSMTTSGIEPVFCSSYKRRYLDGKNWVYQYVIDNVTKKMVEEYNIDPDHIEDAYALSNTPEIRIGFQAWIQSFVDHGISSTMNIPSWGSELNNENTLIKNGNIIMEHLPKLRGLTVYPDGARGGQILTPVKYKTAVSHIGNIYTETLDVCDITKGGTCNS